MLDLLGVRYLIANSGIDARPDLQMVDFGDLRSVRAPGSGAAVAGRVRRDRRAATRTPRCSAWQRPTLTPIARWSSKDLPATCPSAPRRQAVSPEVVGPETWRAHVALPQAGYLLQREAWYPGWRARVDGVEVPRPARRQPVPRSPARPRRARRRGLLRLVELQTWRAVSLAGRLS